ncbi:aspartic proteinase asp1, partial [Phtheirospermum japonicum]
DSSYPCEYEVNYADGGSSSGILVRDWVHLIFRNGSWVSPWIAFGCGYPSKGEVPIHQPINDGVLGLGKGAQGILKQLRDIGVIRNVVGHCLSTQGGGYLFFGDIPLPGIAWKQILHDAFSEHYFLGSADILLNGEVTDIRDLGIMFDSGSTYTYLHSEAYGALLDLVIKNLNGTLKDAADDNTLPVCWGGPFGSLDEAASHFLPLAFNFTDAKNVHFQMDPKSYLIISGKGNVYLGILNGTEVGLEDMNLIGDISMHDKLVIYDNENGMVGWATVETCNLMF